MSDEVQLALRQSGIFGVHELWMEARGRKAYVYEAAIFEEVIAADEGQDPATVNPEFRIVDVSREDKRRIETWIDRDEMLEALARCIPGETVPRSVVVIDDDARDRRLIVDTLEPEGYSVLTAETGEEGLELVQRERPAVVLLDLLMPGLDGFEVVERLRADPSTADVPVVVLTAKDLRPDDRERLAGRISYLAEKGAVGRGELVELVRSLADGSRPRMGELR